MSDNETKRQQKKRAMKVVSYYTGLAMVTGAITVPASSVAIVGEDAFMIANISSIYGHKISPWMIGMSFSLVASANIVARNLFVEVGKALSWGTGNWWAQPLLSVFGSTTAGLQTYMFGLMAIAVAENGGNPLNSDEAKSVVDEARATYDEFAKRSAESYKEGNPIAN